MTPSELAFLALGLLLGIAAGAAILITLRARPPTHEIRVTVTRDAIPRRASTLAADVLHGAIEGPAPGGPGDRRLIDRDDPRSRTGVHPDGLPVVASPVLPWLAQPVAAVAYVPSFAAVAERAAPIPGSIAIHPEPDPILASLGTAAPGESDAAFVRGVEVVSPSVAGLLAGDHRAMLGLIDAIGGPDDASRKAWDTLLSRFVDAVRERSIDLGLLDLPMGNPFWDTFTIDQCRQIVVSLQATGRRFDGRADWADGLVPTYRDLGQAVAETGLDPRRIRAWPNSLEIAELFRGARVGAAEAIDRWAPDLEVEALRAFLADRDRGLEELWPLWDAVRSALGLGAAAAA